MPSARRIVQRRSPAWPAWLKSLALETARKGIIVNCVAPGYTDTDMIAAIPCHVLERYVSRILVVRLCRPCLGQ